jgi:hypothetical protein
MDFINYMQGIGLLTIVLMAINILGFIHIHNEIKKIRRRK